MMETIVLKFGGTSVGSTDRISAVADLIKTACEEASPVVVVSAMSGETNRLIDLANSLGLNPIKESLMHWFQLASRLAPLGFHCLESIRFKSQIVICCSIWYEDHF